LRKRTDRDEAVTQAETVSAVGVNEQLQRELTQIKSEFENEASSPNITNLTEPAPTLNENERGTEKVKQPRRTPAKTALEYHKGKQEDSIGGIRKVRIILRNVNPDKLLQSIAQDPVSAYKAGPSDGVAPIMQVSTKKDFMQQIISNCPEDAFQKFRTELNILDEESRSFGFRRMEMKNGMWLLKGMKSRRFIMCAFWFGKGSNTECSCLSLPDEGCCMDG
jgi:hypothetical protein